MTRDESVNIKDEILRKEGCVKVFNVIAMDGVVLIKDVLDIIDKHTVESGE